jgi:hypothetical protein
MGQRVAGGAHPQRDGGMQLDPRLGLQFVERLREGGWAK